MQNLMLPTKSDRSARGCGFLSQLLLCFLGLTCQSVQAQDVAAGVALHFYQNYQAIRTAEGLTGLPDPAQLQQLARWITPRLNSLLVAARREQLRCRRLFPQDIPPWVDGDIFSSNAEGFTSFRVGSSRLQGVTRAVAVRLTYTDGKNAVWWSDAVSLQKVDGTWRVDDIFYRASFAYTSGFGSHLQGTLGGIPAC